MHVRTDHINEHAGVSGPYGDSTGGISNGAAQFSVLSPNTLVIGGGLYAGSSCRKSGMACWPRTSKNGWEWAEIELPLL